MPKPNENEIELRSEVVQDILSKMPHWLIRWGSLVILLLLLVVFFLSWLIKYPDIIRAEVLITTQVPPEKLIAKTSGNIAKIFVENQKEIPANTPIAIIENAANYENVFLLKSITDTLTFTDTFYFPLEKNDFSDLGTIENAFANFKNSYINYRQYIEFQPHQIEKNSQSIESKQQNYRLAVLQEQIVIATKELQLKKKELDRFDKLFKKGIISEQEWETKEFDYLQQEKNQQQLKSQFSQLQSSLNDLNRNKKNTTTNELKDNVVVFQNTIQAFNQLKKEISEWDMNFVLRSSIVGKVSYLKVWAENQTVAIGEELCSVLPTKKLNYIAKLKVPVLNSGKIKTNQEVVIRLFNYPESEFGMLKGKLKTISLLPTKEGVLLLDAQLTNGLETTHKKQLAFQQEMSGTADIITEDLRLIERLLYQFRTIFDR